MKPRTTRTCRRDRARWFARALNFLGNASLSTETRDALLAFAGSCMPSAMAPWEESPNRAMRQNALRHLILTSSDWQAS